jgi:hypothetical protein
MSNEGRLEHPDLEHKDSVEFDWPALERALGEMPADDAVGDFADALAKLVAWLTEPVNGSSYRHTPADKRIHLAGRRVTVLAWTLRPEAFDNRTLEKVAHELCVQPERLHALSAEFSRRFGVRNRSQISRAASVAARTKPLTP